jgi:hypothetical protein
MEKLFRGIGLSFLYVANAVHEAKDTVDNYLFDLIFRDDHKEQ